MQLTAGVCCILRPVRPIYGQCMVHTPTGVAGAWFIQKTASVVSWSRRAKLTVEYSGSVIIF